MDTRVHLDSVVELEQRDPAGMLQLVEGFPGQLREAVQTAEGLQWPDLGEVDKVVLLGLGGSAIAGDLVKAYLRDELAVPYQVVRHYQAPAWVDDGTLALVSSYSGNTEETLSACEAVRHAGARVVCLTSGGELGRIAEREGYPWFPFPSGRPPRTALPYSFVAVLHALRAAGLIADKLAEVRRSADWAERRVQVLGPTAPTSENQAKVLARKLAGRIPVVYGSADGLVHVARRWAGQFSENGKTLAYFSELPEMNHNEIVGWKHPGDLLRRVLPIFLRDEEDHLRIQARAEITRELLAGHAEETLEFWSAGDTRLERLWSLVLLGDFASVYLAFLQREDPTPVEVIDLLKTRMKQF
ncbi:MAG: bifunctional phosphoglucose/phosphomannose isomerase [Acidobacteriota bacterium]